MYTVKLNVHPKDCDCPRSPSCQGKFVVDMPDTGDPPRTFSTQAEAEAFISERAGNGVPKGKPGTAGVPVRDPEYDRLTR